MTASQGTLVDDMHAAQRLPSINSSGQQQLANCCKWYLRSGTCRAGTCKLTHVRAASVDTHISYDERPWSLSSAEEDDPAADRQAWRFSVASYNILADKYARHYRSYLYHEVPATYLDWHHRRAAILAELAFLQPDIISLQEVDRFEDLEAELQKLGYAGIYLQRDGGRRDGCATFWRQALLQPALVRQVRYSQYDLKDNVALLVLLEPRTAAVEQAAAASRCVQEECDQLQQEQRQQEQQQQQQQQQQASEWQWLPRGWLFGSSANTSASSSHLRSSSQVQLRPVHASNTPRATAQDGSSGGGGAGRHRHHHHHHEHTTGVLYQVPVGQQAPQSAALQQQQQQQQRAGGGSWTPGTSEEADQIHGGYSSAFNNIVDGDRRRHHGSSSNSSSSSSRKTSRHHQRSHGSASRRRSWEGPQPPPQLPQPPLPQQQQPDEQQQPPDWLRCALLVANTHIIFTPEKGDVKLGQARLLLQEAQNMAQWYLEQQQPRQQPLPGTLRPAAAGAAAADGSNSNSSTSSCSKLFTSGIEAVATVLTGDFNSTPNSPLYAYLSRGLLDLAHVQRRNVSHMSAGSSSHHHKGYRGFRRAAIQRRKSLECQQQQLEQQEQHQEQEAAGWAVGQVPPKKQQQEQEQKSWGQLDGGAGGRYIRVGSSSTTTSTSQQAAAAGGGAASSGNSSSPGSFWQQGSVVAVAAGSSPPQQGYQQHHMQQQQPQQQELQPYVLGSSPTPGAHGHHKWSDKEIRRAAGMSYDELVEDSLAHVTQLMTSHPDAAGGAQSGCAPSSPEVQIAWAAAAFGQQVAAGAGAAAAATVAVSAAAAAAGPLEVQQQLLQQGPSTSASSSSSSAAAAAVNISSSFSGAGAFGSATYPGASGSNSNSGVPGVSQLPAPLLLRHGMKLQSSYRDVLGQEPDFTSSHSMFMDTCDYIWYTRQPLMVGGTQQPPLPLLAPADGPASADIGECSSATSSSATSSSTSSSSDCSSEDETPAVAVSAESSGSDDQQQQQYQLRPVAVLVPPDGMRLPKGLPSKSLGSDHICLVTDFALVLKQGHQQGQEQQQEQCTK